MTFTKRLRVLVVDDNPADLHLISEAFAASNVRTDVATAASGEEALSLLHSNDLPAPDIVMLDVNMPRVSGLDVLSDIKTDARLRSTVVIMFSSSTSANDIAQAYDHSANGFVTKPMDLDSYFEIARAVTSFWASVATLPPRHAVYART